MTHEILTSEQQQYIEILIQQAQRSGFDQPEEARWKLAALKKQMDAAASAFESNYNADVTTVSIAEADLRGVDPSFVIASPRDEQGNLLILCNSVSWNAIMPYCSAEHVRRMFYQAYYKRAYPANGEQLQRLLHARTLYAQALGYADYASYMLEVCMLSTSDQVLTFLQDFMQAAQPLFTSFIAEVSQNIPEGVALIEGQLKPWDVAFTLAAFKNRTCGLDQREVSQYFPIQAVMSGMLKVYALFMGVSFEFQEKFAHAWDEAVQGVTVFNHNKTRILGYIFFDLLPRPQKYSHACCWQIIPRVRRHDPQTGILYETPGIATIIANIPLPQQDAPSLLYHDTVRTLFHEFGHALHEVLSCTQKTYFQKVKTNLFFSYHIES
jgi:Zn-dependent oligopeptidase